MVPPRSARDIPEDINPGRSRAEPEPDEENTKLTHGQKAAMTRKANEERARQQEQQEQDALGGKKQALDIAVQNSHSHPSAVWAAKATAQANTGT
jgi:hypothetical protein